MNITDPEQFDDLLRQAVKLAIKYREESWLQPHTLQNPSKLGYYACALHTAAQLACLDVGLGPYTADLVATGITYDWNFLREESGE